MRYLQMKGKEFPLDHIHASIVRLPSLNSLKLVGILSGEEFPLGFGNALKGDFRGQLQLYADLAHRDVFNMLINIPIGLHFTNLHIVEVDGRYFQDALRLMGACKHSLQTLRLISKGESLCVSVYDLSTDPFPGTCNVDQTFDSSLLEILKFEASRTIGNNRWEVPAFSGSGCCKSDPGIFAVTPQGPRPPADPNTRHLRRCHRNRSPGEAGR